MAAASWAGENDRLDRLETENAELRRRLDALEKRDHSGLEAVIETYLSERESEADDGGDHGLGLNLVVDSGSVRGVFQLFGDVGLRTDNPEVPGRSNTFFFSGSTTFFFTARAGDNFHVLSETVFVGKIASDPAETDHGDFDQERLWGAWAFSDAIQIKFGLEHGPISRWNNIYHHGRWLELTINRPFLARFEGGGGILPAHNAGVEVTGKIRSNAGVFEYTFVLSNGRGRIPTDTQEFSDRNDGKAVDLGIALRPKSVPNLWVALFVRVDDIPADPTNPARLRSIREVIGSFQVDYRGDAFEILAEFVVVENRDRQSGMNFTHYAGYVQIAYRYRELWTPYFRFDLRTMDRGDPYYAPFNRDLDVWEALIGIRYDFIPNASLKFEIGFGDREARDGSGTVGEEDVFRLGLQLAWVF